ncbi:hypothetical protein NM688_g6025 [Phlebia brevispora]|uniref:Uncharacterized protein n=1 Tax=Phlebia brevispora TaxID=194682 RepID=A0ACC1SL45_9APHY|nr:hypothetical protein NM688_g6025 [Phlebia brevispora]
MANEAPILEIAGEVQLSPIWKMLPEDPGCEIAASPKAIAFHIKHLVLQDLEEMPSDDAPQYGSYYAELLAGVLGHFRHLRRLDLDTLIPVDSSKLRELASQRLADIHTRTSTPTLLNVDELWIRLWGPWALPTPSSSSVTRFIGLLSLFRTIERLVVHGDRYKAPQDANETTSCPAIPDYLRISALELRDRCLRYTGLTQLLLTSPLITSNLSHLVIEDICPDQVDDFKQLWGKVPVLEHLELSIDTIPLWSGPDAYDGVIPLQERLQQFTLVLLLYPFELSSESSNLLYHQWVNGRAVQSACKLLLTLKRRIHSIRKLNVIMRGLCNLEHAWCAVTAPFHELDELLLELHEGRPAVQTAVILQKWNLTTPSVEPSAEIWDSLRVKLLPESHSAGLIRTQEWMSRDETMDTSTGKA